MNLLFYEYPKLQFLSNELWEAVVMSFIEIIFEDLNKRLKFKFPFFFCEIYRTVI